MTDVNLMSKNGWTMKNLAQDLLDVEVGSRIPRMQDFARKYEVGTGTVHAALRVLEQVEAIGLEPRGHLGTFLVAADFVKLWNLAGRSDIMGAMPLPYSRRYEGLAAGLYEAFERQEIPFHLSYIRGSVPRVRALKEGRCDIVVLSRRAAQLAATTEQVEILHCFQPGSYVGSHGLLVRKGEGSAIHAGMKIGIDSSSTDQSTLTRALCNGIDVEFLEVPYMQLMEQLLKKSIDAAVWNIDEVKSRFAAMAPVSFYPLEFNEDDATEAALLVRKDDLQLFRHLLEKVDMKIAVTVQQEVLNGKRVPKY